MTITKKLLAVLLAGLMLIGFGVGAAAETEEELEALGRALLMQTMEDLRGNYTMEARVSNSAGYFNYPHTITHIDKQYAFRSETSYYEDYTEIEINFGGELVRIYPSWKTYQKIFEWNYADTVLQLESKDVFEDSVIEVRMIVGAEYESGLHVKFEGNTYRYRDGTLLEIYAEHHCGTLIEEFSKRVDQSVFSISGLREVTEDEVKQWLAEKEAFWKTPSLRRSLETWKAPRLGYVFGWWLDTLIHAPFILPIIIPLNILSLLISPFIWIVQQIYFLFR